MKNNTLTGATAVTGIFGYPVAHSMSPAMHNAAFARCALNWVYVPFEVAPANIRAAVASIRALGLRGVNVTVPHKEAVLASLDELDSLAEKIGSINTIVNTNGRLTGYNTDGPGFLKDLTDHAISIKGQTITLVGGGGAGRAIAHTLSHHGAKKIHIYDIDVMRAGKLARTVPRSSVVSSDAVAKAIGESAVLVNATPLGMHAGDPLPVPADVLHPQLFVYDIVYNRTTELLAAARKARCACSGGLGMLLNQGALAFEKWTGVPAPVAVMRKTLLKQLGGR